MGIFLHGRGIREVVYGSIRLPLAPDLQEVAKRKSDIALATIVMSIDASFKGSVITIRDTRVVCEK